MGKHAPRLGSCTNVYDLTMDAAGFLPLRVPCRVEDVDYHAELWALTEASRDAVLSGFGDVNDDADGQLVVWVLEEGIAKPGATVEFDGAYDRVVVSEGLDSIVEGNTFIEGSEGFVWFINVAPVEEGLITVVPGRCVGQRRVQIEAGVVTMTRFECP